LRGLLPKVALLGTVEHREVLAACLLLDLCVQQVGSGQLLGEGRPGEARLERLRKQVIWAMLLFFASVTSIVRVGIYLCSGLYSGLNFHLHVRLAINAGSRDGQAFRFHMLLVLLRAGYDVVTAEGKGQNVAFRVIEVCFCFETFNDQGVLVVEASCLKLVVDRSYVLLYGAADDHHLPLRAVFGDAAIKGPALTPSLKQKRLHLAVDKYCILVLN